MSVLSSPLKWHGGKAYLASRIIELMPPHIHYVEPYAGSLAVLLAKEPEGVSEVVNDLNESLMLFWRVLGDETLFKEFERRAQATPFCEALWNRAHELDRADAPTNPAHLVHYAFMFFVHCRQSLAGRMKSFAPLSRSRTRRGMNEQASAWLSAVEGLPAVHARLKRVAILNRDALDVIRQQDGPDTLFYLDPPYLHETRASTDSYGEQEMSHEDHERLLIILRGLEGKFLLSGYRSELYDDCAAANNWNRHDFDLPNNSAGGASKRRMTECVWVNF